MLIAYQLKHERMLLLGKRKESDETLAVALQSAQKSIDDLLNFQLREIQFILCTYLPQSLSPTAGRQKNCQLTQLDGSIGE